MTFIEWLDAMEADAGPPERCSLPPPERCGIAAYIPPPADFDIDQQPLVEDDDGCLHPAPRGPRQGWEGTH